MNPRRLVCWCTFGLIHWSGRSDGGGMGDAIKCDVCGADRYGTGAVIYDKAERINWDARFNSVALVVVLWLSIFFLFLVGYKLLKVMFT